jgi:glutamate synthase (NADPH/NADH) small chain
MSNLNTTRVPAREVPAAERVTGFGPVDLGYTDADAQLEAERCLQCRRPLCVEGCPVGVDIPRFVGCVSAGHWRDALDAVRAANLLPSICGRVCPQETQCEGACVLGRKGAPVAIGQLERYVGDKAALLTDPDPAPTAPAEPLGRAAVVGGGPAGVTCALELARAGVQVTLFESLHRLGGVLSYGIPVFRLPDEVVDRELAELDRLGVQVETNAVVGRTLTVDELLGERGFDAVFLGVGAGLPKLLGVPGENLAGVLCANEYLTRVNLMGAYDFPEHDTPVLRGRNAVVLGGGNVAMDAARTALRLGAETVTLCYRRTEAEMPARRAEVEHAKEEGVRFLELVSPLGFEGDERGCVRTARFAQMELGEPDEGGRRRPVEAVGAVPVELPCDLAITAIGTNASPLVPLMAPGLELSERGYIVADEDGRTSDPRIWAGGDIVTGAATVILAMGAGKKAAASIVKTLRDGR